MVIRIARSVPLLWRNPNDAQLGSGSSAVRLEALTEAEQRLLRLLKLGIHEPDFARVAADLGVEHTRGQDILLAVSTELESTKADASELRDSAFALSQDFVDSAIGEIVRANLSRRIDGELVLRRRHRARVFIETLDRIGLMLARALAAAGVGNILSTDSGNVLASDVGADGYPARARYAPRIQVAELIVSQGYSNTQTQLTNGHPSNLAKTDVAVLIAHGSLPPERHLSWLRLGVPHLALIFGDAGFEVSELVEPGGGTCLLCRELSRADTDSAWPILAAQLARTSAEYADTVSRWLAVADACRRILDFIDDLGSGRKSRSEGEPREAFRSHPDCPCALVASQTDKKS